MIALGGITLPDSAYFGNEAQYGLPVGEKAADMNGFETVYTGASVREIDIILPGVSDGLSRADFEKLCLLAVNSAPVVLVIGDKTVSTVFRYWDTALELSPATARQTQRDTDSYYGTIRLLEI